MKASAACLDLIKEAEGLSLAWYMDENDGWTIGYGHLKKPGDTFICVTPEGAHNLLVEDVAWAERAVNLLVRVPLSQAQFDALVDFVYNVGAENFSTSTLLRKLNDGDYKGAAKEFGRWVKDDGVVMAGLVKRRERERQLFLGTVAPRLEPVAELHQEQT